MHKIEGKVFDIQKIWLYFPKKYVKLYVFDYRRCEISMLKIILTIVFVLICIALTVIVLLQEGKSQGLVAIGGMAESYWGKNKGRSMEGTLEKFTKFAAIAVLLLALVLNIIW